MLQEGEFSVVRIEMNLFADEKFDARFKFVKIAPFSKFGQIFKRPFSKFGPFFKNVAPFSKLWPIFKNFDSFSKC